MPIFSAAFLIDFAILLGATDITGNLPCEVRITSAAVSGAEQWVEITNPCGSPRAVDTTVLRWAGHDYGWGASALAGELAPGECMVVTRFDQPLLDGARSPAALALFSVYDNALTDKPWSEVVYGDGWTDVAAPSAGEHIELVDGAWLVIDGASEPQCGVAPRPKDIAAACTPDPDMCAQLGGACKLDGMDPDVCNGVAVNVCPGARAMSCQAVMKLCDDEGLDCDHVAKVCSSNLEGCPAPACEQAGELSMPEALATCAAYPSLLGCGEEPDMGLCLALLTWDGCGISSCEWIECQEELAALGGVCPEAMPPVCNTVMACNEAEQTDGDGSCCAEFGHVDSKLDTCAASEGSFCVGCSYEPVLCMTHGCTTPGEEDCCLSPAGETVPC